MPVFRAFGGEEGGCDEQACREEVWETEVAKVKEAACYQAREED